VAVVAAFLIVYPAKQLSRPASKADDNSEGKLLPIPASDRRLSP
jgi:hypothetical protein